MGSAQVDIGIDSSSGNRVRLDRSALAMHEDEGVQQILHRPGGNPNSPA